MSDMKMYNILGVMKGLDDNAKTTQLNESVQQETVYENVEPRGSIMDAVKSLGEKYLGFKKTVNEAAKPDFLDVDKDGNKKEPFKKAVKDKKAVEEGILDQVRNNAGNVATGTQRKDMSPNFDGKTGQALKPTSTLAGLRTGMLNKDVKEGQGPYELYNPKHPKFKANYEKYKAKHPDCTLAEFVAAMKKKEAKMNEAVDDLTDLDAYQFADPDKDVSVSPAQAKKDAAEKRRRLQDIEDRKAEKDDWFSGNDKEPNVRIHRAKYQDEPSDLDEAGYSAKKARAGKDIGKPGKNFAKIAKGAAERYGSKERGEKVAGAVLAKLRANESEGCVDEVAPPGAKAERMVKHIKKGYAGDGKLTKREKGIAYATAWKAHNKGQVEESNKEEFKSTYKKFNDKVKTQQEKSKVGEGVQFGDTVKNSKAELKKAKPAMVKESRVMEETDYFYEKIGKALAEKNPTLDTASSEFNTAVYKEMVAQGIPPNRARNIMKIDDDFMSDVADSYHHCCQEIAECGAPINSFVGGTSELDEIAKLAGLPVRETEVYDEVNHEEVEDNMDEDAMGAVMGGIAGGMVGKTPGAVATGAKLGSALRDAVSEGSDVTINGNPVNVNSIEVDGVNDWDSPDFADAYITYAEFSDGTPLSDEELVQLETEHGDLVNQAAHSSLQGRADFIDEENMGEGNEFSGALAKAKASGAKEFEVDGKKYTVKEDVNINISANGDEDVLALVKKLAGLPGELVPSNVDEPMVDTGRGQVPLRNIPTLELPQDVEEDRDVEYTNTPREETAGLDAAIPSGTDLNRSKKQYKKEYPGDNPMAVKEEALWKSYQSLIKDVKA